MGCLVLGRSEFYDAAVAHDQRGAADGGKQGAAGLQAGVAMASAGELSFNWGGFISAMVSNLTFGFRAVWSKK